MSNYFSNKKGKTTYIGGGIGTSPGGFVSMRPPSSSLYTPKPKHHSHKKSSSRSKNNTKKGSSKNKNFVATASIIVPGSKLSKLTNPSQQSVSPFAPFKNDGEKHRRDKFGRTPKYYIEAREGINFRNAQRNLNEEQEKIFNDIQTNVKAGKITIKDANIKLHKKNKEIIDRVNKDLKRKNREFYLNKYRETLKGIKIPIGEKLIRDKAGKIIGVESNLFRKSFRLDENSIANYSNILNEINFNKISSNIKNQLKKENPSYIIRQLKKVVNFKNKLINFKTKKITDIGSKIIGAKGNKAIGNLYKKLSPANQKLLLDYNKMTPFQKQLVIASVPAEATEKVFKLSSKGWENLLFTTKADAKTKNKLRGLGIKRTPVTEFIPKAITGAGQLAVYIIPGVGETILISDIAKNGKIYVIPKNQATQIMKDSYNEYKNNTSLNENERLLTQKEYSDLNSKLFLNMVKNNALKNMVIDVAFLNMGNILKIFKKAGRIAFPRFAKLSPKYSKILAKNTRKITKKIPIIKKIKTPTKNRINGIKVGKKEFKSFKEAEKIFRKEKIYENIIIGTKDKGIIGTSERISGNILTEEEIKLLSGLKNFKKFNQMNKVKAIDVTTISNKIKLKYPTIKRYIVKSGTRLKQSKGLWRFEKAEKDIYQNTVSYGLIDKNGKHFGSITFSMISSKPLTKFRNALNAIKYGTNKNMFFSSKAGNNFIKSYALSLDKRKKKIISEYISKFKEKSFKNQFNLNIKNPTITVYTTKFVKGGKTTKQKFNTGTLVSKSEIMSGTVKKINKIRPNKKRETLIIIKNKEREIAMGVKKIERVSNDIDFKKLRVSLSKLDNIPKKVKSSKIKNTEKEIKDLKKRAIIIKKNYNKSIVKLRSNLYKTSNKKELSNIRKKLNKSFYKVQNNLGRIEKKIINEKIGLKQDFKRLKQINSKKLSRVSAYSSTGISKLKTPKKKLIGISDLKKEMKKIKNLKKKKIISATSFNIVKKKIISMERLINQLYKSKTKKEMKKKKAMLNIMDKRLKQIYRQLQKNMKNNEKNLKIKIIKNKERVHPTFKIKQTKRRKRKSRVIYLRKTKKKNKTPKFKVLSKPQMTYKVWVKKRGKNILLGEKLIKADAQNLMAYNVDNTLLRSAVIKRQGRFKFVTRLPQNYRGAFLNKQKKFRQYKLKNKKKSIIKGYIEKKKYIKDTKNEKLQLLRLARRKRKQILNKRKKKSK